MLLGTSSGSADFHFKEPLSLHFKLSAFNKMVSTFPSASGLSRGRKLGPGSVQDPDEERLPTPMSQQWRDPILPQPTLHPCHREDDRFSYSPS